MQINDEAILVGKIKYGDSSLILSVFSKQHGLLRGLLKGGLHYKHKSFLEIGNIFFIEKRARLEDSLGFLKLELLHSYLYNIHLDSNKLLALSAICELLNDFTLEKENDSEFYDFTKNTIILLQQSDFIKHYLRWELVFLEHIGFGMDLSKCVVSGESDDLYYLSPRTGKAVSREVGEPYADKLFIIPDIFKNTSSNMLGDSVIMSFKITTHFLQKFSREYTKKIPFTREYLYTKYSDGV